jgi:DNA-binding NarL/FixJ family response regulator
MAKIRIVLADDHALIREGFKKLLIERENPFVELVGEAENGKELLEIVAKTPPDLVLTDIKMPLLSGLDALKEIKEKKPEIKVVILTMHEESEYIKRAISSGADGYLSKNIEQQELERAIKTVFNGAKYFSASVNAILLTQLSEQHVIEQTDISPRENEVLQLVAQGLSTKQIAAQLDISNRTVETHRINLLKKLKANNTAELIKKSAQLKMI